MWLDQVYRPLKLSEPTLKALIWASAAVAFPFVPFRLFVRWKITKKLFVDDGLVVVAYALLLAYAVVWQNRAHDFFLVMDALSGRIPPQPGGTATLQRELHLQVCSVILYGLSLYCIKVSFLLFFQRLGNHVRRQRILWWAVVVYTTASFGVWMAMPPWRCIAASPTVLMERCGDKGTAQLLQRNIKIQTSMDVTSDVAIILLPIGLLWKLKIDLRKKLILGAIFSLTVFTMVASITRIIIVTSESEVLDESWKMTWSAIEASVAIIVACLASFRALYTAHTASQRLPVPYEAPSKDSGRRAFARASARDSLTNESKKSGSSDLTLEMAHITVDSRAAVNDDEQESDQRATTPEKKTHSHITV